LETKVEEQNRIIDQYREELQEEKDNRDILSVSRFSFLFYLCLVYSS